MGEEIHEPKGIRGWLLFFVVIFACSITLGTLNFLSTFEESLKFSFFYFIITIGIICLMWFTLWMVCLKVKIAQTLVIFTLLADFILWFIMAFWLYAYHLAIMGTFIPLGNIIWVFYWWKSKRVKNTFIKVFK